MSTTTVRSAARAPALERDPALGLAAAEYDRFAAVLRELEPTEWEMPTDCSAWDVRAMAGHVLGMAEMVASFPQFVVQNAGAIRAGGGIDALTSLQVRGREALSREELVDRMGAVGPQAVHGRRRLSRLIGRFPVPQRQVVGDRTERWAFAFLLDVVLTRDTWMHRIDICRATARTPELSSEHDGVLVADVVDEWAHRHGRPYGLTLTGPAGGTWS